MRIYLHNSKKSSTFAAAFGSWGALCTRQAKRERGANPLQTRCCEFRNMLSVMLLCHWRGDAFVMLKNQPGKATDREQARRPAACRNNKLLTSSGIGASVKLKETFILSFGICICLCGIASMAPVHCRWGCDIPVWSSVCLLLSLSLSALVYIYKRQKQAHGRLGMITMSILVCYEIYCILFVKSPAPVAGSSRNV